MIDRDLVHQEVELAQRQALDVIDEAVGGIRRELGLTARRAGGRATEPIRAPGRVAAVLKLAVWTPLPPQRSGIADYSSRLVAQLARQAEIVVVVRDDTAPSARAPAGVAVVARSDYDPDAADLDVYHLGNQARFHAYMLEAIRRRPGILVLHDPALPDLHNDLCGGYGSTLFRQEARFDSPEAEVALPVRYVDGRVEVDWLRLPLARRVVEASAVTIVHSAWIRDAFRARYPAARIVHRHHAAVVAAPRPERRAAPKRR